jgi:hypothetical protein
MTGRRLPLTIALAALALAWSLSPDGAHQAQAAARHRTAPDLFYNFYVPPGGCPGVPARLYLCPRPTPPLVGHTYVTYEPLMPHEFLYKHTRTYWRQNPGAGWTRTVVTWQ